jgi:hypothetical protein
VGNITFSRKNKIWKKGKIKKENLKWETRGPVVGQDWEKALRAHQVPDACISTLVGFMVCVWVMFGVVVSPGFGTSIPVITKLVLRCATMELLKLHIHHLAPACNNCFIGNPCGGRVICLDRAFWLGPTHVNEDEL